MVYNHLKTHKEERMSKLLTTQEVAKKLHQSIETVRKWCRLGILPATKIGRKYLVKDQEMEEWIEEKKVKKSHLH
jgi:excisionase family DNA binding protein